MSIVVKDAKDRRRNISEIKAKVNGREREINKIVAKFGNKIYVLWELIVAFITTTDGYGIQTKDSYIVKCKDQ